MKQFKRGQRVKVLMPNRLDGVDHEFATIRAQRATDKLDGWLCVRFDGCKGNLLVNLQYIEVAA
jgi:hypothetical protein